jgi:formylglycine-generating enzyme required for sulfatase activity
LKGTQKPDHRKVDRRLRQSFRTKKDHSVELTSAYHEIDKKRVKIAVKVVGYSQKDVADPQGAKVGTNRVLRGGSWGSHPIFCRSANRNFSGPDNRTEFYGLRVCFYLE